MKRLTTLLTAALLSVLTFSLTSCEPMDDYDTAYVLNGTWHGVLGQYYMDIYGEGYEELETEFRFSAYGSSATSGEGIEIDYNPRSWSEDYKYYNFRWEVVYGDIYMYFSNGDRLIIRDYYLSDSRLRGRLVTESGQLLANLDLDRTSYWPWDASYAKRTRAGVDSHAGKNRHFE